MLRKRLTALLVISPLVAALCAAAYKFAPTSSGKTGPTEVNVASETKPIAAEESPQSHSKLFELFGIYEKAVGTGQVKGSASDYLNSIEALYRQRGYEKIDTNNLAPLRKGKFVRRRARKATPSKFFQRQETNGISSISATGIDADYTTNQQSNKPFSFSTLVTQGEDGTVDWATYRLEIDQNKLRTFSGLENGDFPGDDPPNVPRFEGLRRIYALTSERGSVAIYKTSEQENSLMFRYLAEMPRLGWRLDDQLTSNANKAARGVMCFTRGQKMCLIWVSTNGESTNVTISAY